MEKIIVRNDTDMPLLDVFPMVQEVIKTGRISNGGKQYCYLTAFRLNNRNIHVVTDANKKSNSFIIYEATDNKSLNPDAKSRAG